MKGGLHLLGDLSLVTQIIVHSIVSGILATAVLDIWQRILFAVSGIPPTNWGMVGRWFAHMPRGKFVHDSIADAEPVANEAAVGWIMHYLIGIIYGFVFVGLIAFTFRIAPIPVNGFVFGAASVVVSWFLMQPALGLGVMGSKAPKPAIVRYTALADHCIYGVALSAGAIISLFLFL